jgi:hypothetical protein
MRNPAAQEAIKRKISALIQTPALLVVLIWSCMGQATIQICHWGSRYAPSMHPRRRRKLPLSVLHFRLLLLRLPLGPANDPDAMHDHR